MNTVTMLDQNRLVRWMLAAVAASVLLSPAGSFAQQYQQTNLVANASGLGAKTVDPKLVDPWGTARATTSPWWVADRASGVVTIYDATGTKGALTVAIPHGSPTGQVFNGSPDFALTPGNPAYFLFVSLSGAISGWNPAVDATKAVVKVPPSTSSILTGVTIGQIGNARYLYVADLRQARIKVYDTNFVEVASSAVPFADRNQPAGYAPFNVQNIGNNIYVTWAQQNAARNFVNFGPGLGYVDIFTPSGVPIGQLEQGPWFNAPFGLVLAPTDFGSFSHKLIVGQFGSGEFLAFDDQTLRFEGKLVDKSNKVIAISGLWGISFGAGQPSPQTSGPGNALFFAAGINFGNGGLFGTLTPLPADLTQGGDQ